MVFLMQQRFKEQGKDPILSDSFNFIPYDYGPFSKDLYAELDSMSEKSMIKDSVEEIGNDNVKYDYSIQNQGIEFVENQIGKEEAETILQMAEEIKEEYNDVVLSDLIEDVYAEYPEYAKNSIY
nr:type II toxin-antitoxin system antitoxin SocA domain-containing protein [Haloterrigena salifodinae]